MTPKKSPVEIQQALDEYIQNAHKIIAEHGWMVQTVLSNPSYSYTCGLSRKGLPEIIVMGLSPNVAQSILNGVAQSLIDGKLVLQENKLYSEIFDDFTAKFRKISSASVSDYLRIACVLTRTETRPQAWQLIWPDPKGKFEGDADMDQKFVAMQNLAFTAAR